MRGRQLTDMLARANRHHRRRRHREAAVDGDDEYKGLLTRASIWGQAHRVPGSSPAAVTRAAKKLADRYNPRLVQSFIEHYGIDYAQAERCSARDTVAQCAARYGTLNEFFTRRIRGIAIDAAPLVSPATCRCVAFDTFLASGVWVKGRHWSAAALVGADIADADYAVGVFRLAPADYHRFGAPCDAVVESVVRIPGVYLSVDPAVVSRRDVFTVNTRVVVQLRVPGVGRAYFVAVGAAGVGSVKVTPRPGEAVTKGQDMGCFEFGGSTVVLLLPAGVAWRRDLTARSLARKETRVRIGEAI